MKFYFKLLKDFICNIQHFYRISKKFNKVLISKHSRLGSIDGITIGEGSSIMAWAELNTSCPSASCAYVLKVEGTITLGKKCSIRNGAILTCAGGGEIVLGDNVQINPYCILYGYKSLKIGSNTLIAAHTVIVPNNHTFTSKDRLIKDQAVVGKGIVIGEDVWIGTNVAILDGVQIGRGAIVGASSVVTKDIPDYAIAIGCPARVIRLRVDAS